MDDTDATASDAQKPETTPPSLLSSPSSTSAPHRNAGPHVLRYGSGTTSMLAINAFQQRAEGIRMRNRSSESSNPRSRASHSRQNNGRIGAEFAASGVSAVKSASSHTVQLDNSYDAAIVRAGPTAAAIVSPPLPRGINSPKATDLVQSMINSSPSCYAGDDGSTDLSDRYNFFVHGKRFLFATCSLGIFDESSRFRHRVIWCITSKRFDRVVLALIVANSIILAIADLRYVDASGDLDATHSQRNAVVAVADSVFTALFSVECSLKIVAMGLIAERGAYLMDPWNWVDFIVVAVGIVAVIPGIPNVAALRAFRVLRPLRFFNAVSGIKKLVSALLQSIPELLTVVAFLSFLFFLYGVVGVQLWSGVLHSRCRLTPYPVRLDPTLSLDDLPAYQSNVVANPALYRCRDDANNVVRTEDAAWTHDTSPWRVPKACYWPVAPEARAHMCNLNGATYRQCPSELSCGSDYDNHGNFRFAHPDDRITQRVLHAATYSPDLNYGLMSFDNIGAAALVLFICMPREGWSDLMYMLYDTGYSKSAAIYFTTFLIASSYFMLNLALAVIWENFSDAASDEAEANKARHELELRLARQRQRSTATSSYGSLSPVRMAVRRVVQHWTFNVASTLLILLNTVILSLDQYPIDSDLVDVVDAINAMLTLAFAVECALKLAGVGFRAWCEDTSNVFDALVVVVGIVELGLAPPHIVVGHDAHPRSHATNYAWLRSLRIFALFKLAKHWPSLQKLLETIVRTVREIGNFSVLLVLFMYIYALIGMQLFGNRFRFDIDGFPVTDLTQPAAYVPRANFDTMLWSMVTIFQILTGENWTNILIDSWRATGWPCVLYFVSLVVFGNFIILNLFLAILLANFETPTDDPKCIADKEALRHKARVVPQPPGDRPNDTAKRSRSRSRSRRRNVVDDVGGSNMQTTNNVRDGPRGQGVNGKQIGSRSAAPTRSTKAMQAAAFAQTQRTQRNRSQHAFDLTTNEPLAPTGRALFVFAPRNVVRRHAHAIVHHPTFDTIMLVLLAVSTISVALDNPLVAPDSTRVRLLAWLDLGLTVLFGLEVALKVVAQGLYFTPHGYLTNRWNVLDFCITTVGILSLQSSNNGSSNLSVLQNLRLFRALRPLRMITRHAGMKLVVRSLLASVPQILNVLVVVLLLLTIFSIIAVNNLKGKLFSCRGDVFDALSTAQQTLVTHPRRWHNLTTDEQMWFRPDAALTYQNISSVDAVGYGGTAAATATALTSKVVCALFGATWTRTIPQSFDNVLVGCRTFFEISTTEGWVTLMLASVDATAIDMQPIANSHEGWTLFFIAFIFVGSFFVTQLFIGVVIENYSAMKAKLDGTDLLSAAQREWLLISTAVLALVPQRKLQTPRSALRRLCFRIAQSPLLETVVMGCILLNTFILALTYFGQANLYGRAINASNYVVGLVFVLEAAVKITGLGRAYWREPWNVFDFVIVFASTAGSLYVRIRGAVVGASALPMRSIRVARLVKLVKTAPSLRQLVNTLRSTLPSLVSIGGLLSLIFFIYAALGVQLFAKVKMGDIVTSNANFQSIGGAMSILMRCATGERWNDLMHELASTRACESDPPYNASMCGFSANATTCAPLTGCGTPVAFVYFCSFTLLVTFVLLNIFIAVILEGFANEKDRAHSVLLPQHYDNFVATWSAFDPEATGYIEWHALPRLVQQLDEPLGFGRQCAASGKEMTAFIEFLDISIYGGNRVFFSDVARKLGKFVLDVVNDGRVRDLPQTIEIVQKWRAVLEGSKIRTCERSTHRLNQLYAAVLLQNAVRSLIFRDELRARVVKFTTRTNDVMMQHAATANAVAETAAQQRSVREDEESSNDDDDGSDSVGQEHQLLLRKEDETRNEDNGQQPPTRQQMS